MIFEEGRTYIHTTGKKIKIVGTIDSYMYGSNALVSEDLETGELIPVGREECHTINWHELLIN